MWSADETSWCIRDVGSSNGTVVNGKVLEPEVVTRPLKDGDRIKLGLQSELLIQVVDVPDENMTVEQYLNKECDRRISKIQVGTQPNSCFFFFAREGVQTSSYVLVKFLLKRTGFPFSLSPLSGED